MPINFFSEEIDFKIQKPNTVKKWLHSTVLEERGGKIKTLNYIFCNDGYLLSINKQFLDHDDYTDIITFDNSEQENEIEGDIYISIDRIANNAEKYSVVFSEELYRVIIHGLLHLLGYKDKSSNDKATMTEKENLYLTKKLFN